MKSLTSLILFLLIGLANAANAGESATDILNRAAAHLRAAKSVEADFTLSSSAHAGVLSGSILMSAQRFRITSPHYSSWYDGTTQWVLNPADKEVNITTPTAEELQMVNPVMVLNKFSRYYTPTLLKSPKSQRVLRLTAKQKNADIRKAVITLHASSLMPQAITLTAANGTTVTIKLAGAKIGGAVADTYFRFSPKAHPGVEIIDLR